MLTKSIPGARVRFWKIAEFQCRISFAIGLDRVESWAMEENPPKILRELLSLNIQSSSNNISRVLLASEDEKVRVGKTYVARSHKVASKTEYHQRFSFHDSQFENGPVD